MKDDVNKRLRKFVYRGRERNQGSTILHALSAGQENAETTLRAIERAFKTDGDQSKLRLREDQTTLRLLDMLGHAAHRLIIKDTGGRPVATEAEKLANERFKAAQQAEFDQYREKYQAMYFWLVVCDGMERGAATTYLYNEVGARFGLQPTRQKSNAKKRRSPVERLKPRFPALYDSLREGCAQMASTTSPEDAAAHYTELALKTVKKSLGLEWRGTAPGVTRGWAYEVDMPAEKVRAYFNDIAKRAARQRKPSAVTKSA